MRRLMAIGIIWAGCALAWMILGGTLTHRGGERDGALHEEVRLLWGPSMTQLPPTAQVVLRPDDETRADEGKAASGEAKPAEASPEDQPAPTNSDVAPEARAETEGPPPETQRALTAPLRGSDIDVNLDFEQRRKGLLWFPTYAIDFRAVYRFANPEATPRDVHIRFPLAADNAVYDAFEVRDGEGQIVDATVEAGHAVWTASFAPQQEKAFTVSYRSRGTKSWAYGASSGAQKIRDFELRLAVNDADIDFPAGTISPTEHQAQSGQWSGKWTFGSLVTSAPIGLELPQRLNPGPLVAKITFFAPVSLLFFFFVVAVLAAARRKSLHPMHYFLLGCAFFAFHLLFAYTVDHVDVGKAFGISALVSTVLVVSYARLFTGWRFALVEIGISQLLYLVLFSFTFFFEGFTGLAVTIGAIATLFVIMQITGRIDWNDTFISRPKPPGPPGGPMAPTPYYGPAPAYAPPATEPVAP